MHPFNFFPVQWLCHSSSECFHGLPLLQCVEQSLNGPAILEPVSSCSPLLSIGGRRPKCGIAMPGGDSCQSLEGRAAARCCFSFGDSITLVDILLPRTIRKRSLNPCADRYHIYQAARATGKVPKRTNGCTHPFGIYRCHEFA